MIGCVGILIETVHYLRTEGPEILRGALINWQVIDGGGPRICEKILKARETHFSTGFRQKRLKKI